MHTFAPKMFFDILSALYTNECIVLKISVLVSVDTAKYCLHNLLHKMVILDSETSHGSKKNQSEQLTFLAPMTGFTCCHIC